jgi:hypothetical protein
LGASHVKLLSGAEIKAWLASEPLAVKTRNRHLGYIRNVFSLAEEWNLIDADPFKKVNGFNDPHAKARQVAILTQSSSPPYCAPPLPILFPTSRCRLLADCAGKKSPGSTGAK